MFWNISFYYIFHFPFFLNLGSRKASAGPKHQISPALCSAGQIHQIYQHTVHQSQYIRSTSTPCTGAKTSDPAGTVQLAQNIKSPQQSVQRAFVWRLRFYAPRSGRHRRRSHYLHQWQLQTQSGKRSHIKVRVKFVVRQSYEAHYVFTAIWGAFVQILAVVWTAPAANMI